MNFYKITSLVKFILGLIILLLVYSYINVYDDPAIGLGLGFLGLFITLWGGSFYVFMYTQNIFRSNQSQERIIKDSYKLSLLFGIYSIINILFIFLGHRSKILGIVLLLGFIFLQVTLLKENKLKHGKSIG